jgi:TetR/AcrR family transcriptional regulator, transcriptional repressor for nem operon
MNTDEPLSVKPPSARSKLIDAAHQIVRRKGYAGTSIDDICAAAGVSKGAFFHHFASKEALAVAAAEQWTVRAAPLFDAPCGAPLEDPLDVVLAHIDLRFSMLAGPAEDYTCFVGTMVQEAFATSDAIRAASDVSITAYAERLAIDIQRAIDRHGVPHGVTAQSLAYYVQAVLQGAFVLAKAKNDSAIARDAVSHLKRYVLILFGRGEEG